MRNPPAPSLTNRLLRVLAATTLIATTLVWGTDSALAAPGVITGTVFEDIAGDVLNDGVIGDPRNPVLAGVPVSIFRDESSAQTTDSPGEVGQYASIAIGSDGNPVVAYGDSSSGDLKVLHCIDPSCSAYSVTTAESAGSVGQSVSLAIGADGFPVISHYDWGNFDLRVYKCSNLACTAGSGVAVDTTGSQGSGSSIGIGVDGLPIISYFDGTSYDLKVAHCNDAACTTSTITAIDTASTTGVASSLTIGSDGLAVISYRYVPGADLKVAHCNNVTCTSGTSTTVDTPGDLAGSSSIVQGSDGFPVVAYFDLTNRNLKVAHCTNLTCTTRNITTVDGVDDVGYGPSVVIGLDGNPIIAHYDATNDDLKIAYCSNLDCSSATSSSPDTAGNVGLDPSITLGAGGGIVVAYRDEGNRDLKILTGANGAPDGGDTFVSTTSTNGSGIYSFSGLPVGDYLVVVESLAIASNAGYDGVQTDSWAEQTYGPIGSLCADGAGGTSTRSSAGPCYGGAVANKSDGYESAAPDVVAAEHVAVVAEGAASADFGFSFNTVTNAIGGNGQDDASGNRTVQGTLRQFIQNANAITGANSMRFVPVAPTNSSGGGGNWWRMDVTNALPTTTGGNTTIDGTAYSLADGATAVDPNPGVLGTGGVVGVDDLVLPQLAKPELELAGAAISHGLRVEADDATIRRLALQGFVLSDIRVGDPGVPVDYTNITVEENLVGSSPGVLADPGVGNRTDDTILVNHADGGFVQKNLVVFGDEFGIRIQASGTDGWTISANEIRDTGLVLDGGLDLKGGNATASGNLIADTGGTGIVLAGTGNVVENNTIENSGLMSPYAGVTALVTSDAQIRKNVVTGSSRGGVFVGIIAPSGLLISQNEFGGNGANAIDLLEAGAVAPATSEGDGITPNTGVPPACGTDAGSNEGLDAPVIGTANTSTATGTACAGATVEVYRAVADGDASDTLTGTDYGEGVEYLGSAAADGVTGVWSLSGITGLLAGDEVSATATNASNSTSEFAANVTAAAASYEISGTVFEDISGDVLNDGTIGDANNPGLETVVVHLYHDIDGDGIAEVSDPYVTSELTDVNGDYSFTGQPNGKYFVVVNSFSVQPNAGIDTLNGWLATDVWAEQTYGPAVSECADGAGGTVNDPTAGPCYGGRRAGVSDGQGSWWVEAEHLAKIGIASADVPNIDFGFSFNVVTTTAGGDNQDDDPAATLKSVQGSLRQFTYNANATLGANAMRFVPAEPTNATDGTNDWWRVAVTESLPSTTGDGTSVDGRAFGRVDGFTLLDPNTAQIGAGVAVGTDGTYTTPKLDPELEIWNDRGTAVLPTGLVFEADDSVLRHVSIWGFGDSAGTFDANVRFGTNFNTDPDFTGSLVEFNVIGTGPTSFTDPGVGNRSEQINLAMRETDNAIVRDNLIGFTGGKGVSFSTASNSGTVLRNEIRRNGILDPVANPVGVWVTGDVIGNLVIDNSGGIFSGPTSLIEYLDNTITLNGWGGSRPDGIYVTGSSTIVQRNVISANYGAGVVVKDTVANSVITRNSFSGNGTGNGQIGIDLLKSGDDPLTAPFVSLNDDGDADLGANTLLNYPVLDTATIVGTDLVVNGWVKAGGGIEFYKAAPDPTSFGEGETWLITMVEGSVDDTDATAGTYGPGAINGILQGTDTTNRFEFTIPLASMTAPVSPGDELTAMTFSFMTSEFGGTATVTGPFVVNSTRNIVDASVGDGLCDTGFTNTQGAAECTLWAATLEANAAPDADTIEFNIPTTELGYNVGGDYFSIQPAGGLPWAISEEVVIDGYTQPGAQANTVAAPGASDAVLKIEVNGTSAGGSSLFSILGDNSTIRGLVINGGFNIGIAVQGNNNAVAGNYVGTDVTGLAAAGNTLGLQLVNGATGNTFGGGDAGDRNLVSGNSTDGIRLNTSTTTNNTISGNYIGTDVSGAAPLSNGESGVEINAAFGNTIGGSGAAPRNIISGNTLNGVAITGATATGNAISGNYIGTNAAGSAALANNTGVAILGDGPANTIGGSIADTGNVISGNTTDGIRITGAATQENLIKGNYIGTDATGTVDLGNGQSGVEISAAFKTAVGGVGANERNIISGNGISGIAILSGATTTLIYNNYIGTDVFGGSDLGNTFMGVGITSGSTGNFVGGALAGQGNLISGNDTDGVYFSDVGTDGNFVFGNYIGTDATGVADLGNSDDGVHIINGASGNIVGGDTSEKRNLISGNNSNGVEISGPGSTLNEVSGNYIGVNAPGNTALANISGVRIYNGAASNTVGGTVAGYGNVISGNTNYGVDISGAGTNSNSVSGNYIGTDVSGTADLGNDADGVAIRNGAQANTVGGVVAPARNIISGNDNVGIWITGFGTVFNVVRGNWIGYGSDNSDIGNSFHGVAVENDASNNLIGGTLLSHGNRIGNSAWDGVAIAGGTGTGNAVIGNSIVSNTGLGIDFENDGVTPNDVIPGDGDTGPNGLLNFPEILTATESGGIVTLTGVFDVPQGDYRFEFFKNPSGADPSGNGEGESIAGSAGLSHTAFIGDEPFGAAFPGAVGDVITATVTECTDPGCTAFLSTSEFSAAVTVTSANTAPVANNDAAGAGEDAFVVVNVKINDTDAQDGIPAGPAAVVAQPLHGAAVANAGGMGTVTYTPDPDYFGPDAFTYTIDDSGGLTSNVATVSITVTGTPDPPTATDDGPHVVLEDGSLAVDAQDVQFGFEFGSAGSGNGQFLSHRALAVASDGSVYVVDTGNDRIQKFDAFGTYLLQWGTPGTGNGQFDTPMGVTVAADGTVYVTDTFNDRIQYFDATGAYLGSFGTTGAGPGQFDSPRGLAVGLDGDLYVADSNNHRIQVLSPSGIFQRQWGSLGAGDGQMTGPRDVVVDPLGNVFVTDSFNDRVQKFDTAGVFQTKWGSNGTGNGQFDFPRGIDVDAAGNVWVADSFNHRIQVFDGGGTFLHVFGTNGPNPAEFDSPYGLAIGPDGSLYIGDLLNGRIQEFAQVGPLANDIDPDLPADTLTATVSTDVSNGTLVLGPDGTFNYTPDPDYFGPDSFVYEVCDTSAACDTATVTLTVTPVNDVPAFVSGGNIAVGEDSGPVSVSGWAGSISVGPANESAQVPAFTITGNTNPGLFAVAPAINPGTGNLTFTPTDDAFGTSDITLALSDDGGTADGGVDTSAPVVFTITVTGVNDAPSFTAGGNVAVDEDSGAYSAAWASAISQGPANESAQTVLFNVTGNTNPGLFGAGPAIDSSGNLTFTPAGDPFGAADITVELQDNGGTGGGGADMSAPVVFTITVDAVNDAPSFTPGGGVGLGEDNGPATVPGWASAMSPGPANESSQTLAFNTTGNTNPALFSVSPTLDPFSGDLTFTPAPDANGSAIITVELQDNGGTANGGDDTSAPINFAITVNQVNDSPVLDPVGPQTGDEGTLIGFTATASDVDVPADVLTFTLEDGAGSIPAGAAITAGGAFTWTPTEAQGPGVYSFDVVVTDDGTPSRLDRETIIVTVDEANIAPSLNAIGAQSGDEGTVIGFTATATDADLPTNGLTFTLEDGAGSVPAGAAIAAGGVFTWTPTEAQGPGVYSFDVVVTDDGAGLLEDRETISVTVDEVNIAPSLNAIGAQSGDEGTLIGFTASATDADLPVNGLTFSLEDGAGSVPAGAAITVGGVFTFTPSEVQGPGAYSFDVVVSDDGVGLLEDRETITVTVNEANIAPVLDPIGAQSGDEGTVVGFTATAADTDIPADVLTFSLEDGLGLVPPGVAITAGGVFTWIPSEAQGPGVFSFDVVVTDDGAGLLEDRETITVTVNEANIAPVLDPVSAQSGDEGTLIGFTATATDADLPANTLTLSLEDGAGLVPPGAAITAGGVFTFTPSEAQGPGVYSFDVVVTDDGTGLLEDRETITVTVNEANIAPVLDPVGAQTTDELALLSFTATASDADLPGNGLTFTLEDGAGSVPAGASIAAGGLFTFTPSEVQGPGLYSFDVVVTDDGTGLLEDRETITVTVNEANVAPVSNLIADQFPNEGATVSLMATATDSDAPANGLSWSQDSGPGAVDGAGNYSWVTGEADGPGTYTVVLRVTDDGSPNLDDTVSFDITVAEVDVAPVLDPVGARSGDEGTVIGFTATAADPDVPGSVVFSLEDGAGLVPPGAVITAGGVFTWTPSEAQGPGVYTFDVVVTDNRLLEDRETITITVNEANTAPSLNVLPSPTQSENTFITFAASAIDGDTPPNALTYSLVGEPAGATINPISGVFAWIPTETQGPGIYTFDVVVTDDGTPNLTDTDSITITVLEFNRDPVLDPVGALSGDEGTLIGLTATATDLDQPANSLTFTLEDGPGAVPAGAVVTAGGVFTWTPSEAQGPGSYTFDVVVTDDGTPAAEDRETITVTVTETNQAPTLAAVGSRSVDELTTLGFTASASDPDLPLAALTFTVAGAPAGAAITAGGVFSWTPTEIQGPGAYTFDVVVTDNGIPNLEDRETITVTVAEVDTAPTLNPVGDRLVDEGSLLVFAVTSSDPDVPSNRSYSLEDGPGLVPSGAGIDPLLGLFGWSPTEAQGPGAFTFDVVVTDNTGLQDRETITITVAEINQAPVLDPIGDRSIAELVPLAFSATASDPDDPANTLTFSLAGGPAGASITSGGVFSWTPAEAQGPGVFTFDIVVADDGAPAAGDSETITVTVGEVNAAPVLGPIGDRVVEEEALFTFVAAATDPDVPADALTFSLIGAPAGASIDSAVGAFSWTPTEAQGPGTYPVTFIATDGSGVSDIETISISVDEVNQAPTIVNPGDQVGGERLAVNLALVGGDDDEPVNLLTWSATGLPDGLSIDPAAGVVSGMVSVGAAGSSPFAVTIDLIDDGVPSAVASAAFSWTVAANGVPDASPDFYEVGPGATLVVGTPGVLGNDTDPDGDILAATVLVPPSAGTLAFSASGGFTYVHNGGATVEDVFVYEVDDGRGGSSLATVKISILEPNLPPTLTDDLLSILEDAVGSITPLANDSDPNGDPLALIDFTQPEFGLLVASADGTLSFSPPADFHGALTSIYTASDGQGGVATGQISIVVAPVNDLPIGQRDVATLDTYLPFVLDVLGNDGDVDGDFLRVTGVLGAMVGEITINSDGTLTYRPATGFVGTDTFQYRVADGAGGIDTVSVFITVPEEVLAVAIARGKDIGSPSLGFKAPEADLSEGPSITFGLAQGVSLLADAFFQSLGALQLPILFLGLALGSVVVLGGFTELPMLLATRRRRYYSVVLLGREHRLAARSEAGPDESTVYYYEPTAAGFQSLDKAVKRDGGSWIPVESPNGAGWVETRYLTETVDLEFFLEDDRPDAMLQRLAHDLLSRKDLSALFSSRGFALALGNEPEIFEPGELQAGLTNRYASEDSRRIWETALEPLGAALRAAGDLDTRSSHSRAALIPVELWNFQYLAVNAEGHPPWLVYFEYDKGQPKIVGIGLDV